MQRLTVVLLACAGLALSLPGARAAGETDGRAPQTTAPATTGALPVATPSPGSTAMTPDRGEAATRAESSDVDTAIAAAIREALGNLPAAKTEEDQKEHAALAEFYAARAYAPLWVVKGQWHERSAQVRAEIVRAGDYGLEAADFALPGERLAVGSAGGAAAELQLSEAALLYARHARGGRIMDPAEQLHSNLNRVPQLVEPKEVLDGLAAASDAAEYLRSLHPQHPQFERLRGKYVEVRDKDKTLARRLIANMEQWRWMWTDMGDLHLIANVPEHMIHLHKDGHEIHSERIAVGETDKQTAVFTRTLKHIVLRPMWRVPESIMVRELLPSLRRGGGLMRQYGLQLETKDGKKLDWRTIDWSTTDIRQFNVTQPPGPKNALGKVKFSFPSQYTIYMHDTPDKWMFNPSRRTLTHGCMRLRNPMKLAEILLKEDKGWEPDQIEKLSRSGPLDNHIAIERKIPFHMTYFTVWIGDDGKVHQYRDVYGHEKRIGQALDKQWSRIDKGRDYLAPVQPVASGTAGQAPRYARVKRKSQQSYDLFGALLGE